jgi:hypothetical protein
MGWIYILFHVRQREAMRDAGAKSELEVLCSCDVAAKCPRAEAYFRNALEFLLQLKNDEKKI